MRVFFAVMMLTNAHVGPFPTIDAAIAWCQQHLPASDAYHYCYVSEFTRPDDTGMVNMLVSRELEAARKR